MSEKTLEKLKILADAAKYDVSCASSGTSRAGTKDGIGSAVGWGICHSFTPDGRCVSLFKVLLTNHCIYDCAYCSNRRSNDVKRTAFTPDELAELNHRVLSPKLYRRAFSQFGSDAQPRLHDGADASGGKTAA